MIEEGRKQRPRINRADRLCLFCSKLEDEIHFLIDCKRYKEERTEMYEKIEKFFPNFRRIIDSKSKFIFLMSQENMDTTKIIATYIHRWYQIREQQMPKIDHLSIYLLMNDNNSKLIYLYFLYFSSLYVFNCYKS